MPVRGITFLVLLLRINPFSRILKIMLLDIFWEVMITYLSSHMATPWRDEALFLADFENLLLVDSRVNQAILWRHWRFTLTTPHISVLVKGMFICILSFGSFFLTNKGEQRWHVLHGSMISSHLYSQTFTDIHMTLMKLLLANLWNMA